MIRLEMFSEYLTDIGVLCNKAGMTTEESDALYRFAKSVADNSLMNENKEILGSIYSKIVQCGLGNDLLKSIMTPKSWDMDFDGENGMPSQTRDNNNGGN